MEENGCRESGWWRRMAEYAPQPSHHSAHSAPHSPQELLLLQSAAQRAPSCSPSCAPCAGGWPRRCVSWRTTPSLCQSHSPPASPQNQTRPSRRPLFCGDGSGVAKPRTIQSQGGSWGDNFPLGPSTEAPAKSNSFYSKVLYLHLGAASRSAAALCPLAVLLRLCSLPQQLLLRSLPQQLLLRSRPQRQLQVKSFIVGDFSSRTSRFEGKWSPTSFVASIDDSFLFSCLNAGLRSGTAKLCQEQVRPGQPAHLRAGLVPVEARLLRGGALSSARPN